MNDVKLEYIEDNIIEAQALLLTSFKMFIKVFHYYIYKSEFTFKDFHLLIIDKLESLVYQTNTKRNLAIAIPPRTGKSSLIKYFIAWTYAINKDCNNIYTSYSQKLIEKFSAEIRDIINTPLYKKLFCITLKQDTTAKTLWQIEGGGQLVASPIGGSITGFGFGCSYSKFGGCLTIDDPLNANNYNSKIERENCIDAYINTLKSRANNQETAPIILIMQRLHKEDLFGWLQENEADYWDFVSLSAINDKGDSIFPEKLPLNYLENIKNISLFTYQAQYLQQPISTGGNIIKSEWFNTYELLPKLEQVYITVDTALKTGQQNDFSVFQLWGKERFDLGCNYYLIDEERGKWEAPELEENILSFYEKSRKYNCNCLYIEDKASGTGLIQFLQRKRINVQAITPNKDKYLRLSEVLPTIASGRVFIPAVAGWKLDFLGECEAFTQDNSHDHDDQVDCLSMALNDNIIKFNNLKYIL